MRDLRNCKQVCYIKFFSGSITLCMLKANEAVELLNKRKRVKLLTELILVACGATKLFKLKFFKQPVLMLE